MIRGDSALIKGMMGWLFQLFQSKLGKELTELQHEIFLWVPLSLDWIG